MKNKSKEKLTLEPTMSDQDAAVPQAPEPFCEGLAYVEESAIGNFVVMATPVKMKPKQAEELAEWIKAAARYVVSKKK